MKLFLIVSVALCVVVASEAAFTLESVFHAKWQNFKAQHGKSYECDHEEHNRKQHFLEHTHHIESHNEKFHRGEADFAMAHNEFSDMSHHEFKNTRMGFRAPPPHMRPNVTQFRMSLSSLNAPASVDWRSQCHDKVKNQGECGSCYAFATTGSLEGCLARKYGKSYDLSEQNLVDCSIGNVNNGCDGGLMTSSFAHIKKAGGINHQVDYPYTGKVGRCSFKSGRIGGSLNSHVEVRPTEADLANSIATVGPVAVAVNASPRSFMMYSKGIYSDTGCTSDGLNHAVLCVGYGVENGREFWIVKNSWGTGWGEKGYIRMAKNSRNMCGIASMASYPVV